MVALPFALSARPTAIILLIQLQGPSSAPLLPFLVLVLVQPQLAAQMPLQLIRLVLEVDQIALRAPP